MLTAATYLPPYHPSGTKCRFPSHTGLDNNNAVWRNEATRAKKRSLLAACATPRSLVQSRHVAASRYLTLEEVIRLTVDSLGCPLDDVPMKVPRQRSSFCATQKPILYLLVRLQPFVSVSNLPLPVCSAHVGRLTIELCRSLRARS